MRTDRTWHPSPLELDLLLLEGEDGDDGEARARIERHLERCRACAAVHQAGQAAAARFRAEVLPRRSRELHALCGVTRTRRPLRLTLFGLIPALAGGLAAAALIAFKPARPGGAGQALGVAETFYEFGLKGPSPAGDSGPEARPVAAGPRLRAFARREERVFAVTDDAVLAAGDALRFTVDPRGHGHLLIVSIDGAGKTSVYFPYGGSQSERIDPRARFEVPGSIVLDASPGPERVFALLSKGPIDGEAALAALRALGKGGGAAIRRVAALPLEGTAQSSLLFEKGTPRATAGRAVRPALGHEAR